MLKLKNVSKFYYNNGVIASGFSKVNITFDDAEFVVITGESGSGKSTLLNVISGLDSYEEGEMYINGKETSHYRECDFEDYRKKYVSNIFQNFNLVNSYTVYQNIELVLLIGGYNKRDARKRVLELIDKVGLNKYKNTKVSKLSGGQKQKVAIARALAKDTPIIVCDEPTGNLDSKSSMEVIKLLKEVSKDKLLIMVTHDFSSVEKYASRIIKMHDGRIISDKKLVNNENSLSDITTNDKKMGFLNIIRLGIRNTFNIFPKFILLFIVFLFITISLLTEYGSIRKSEYESSKLGYNYYFSDLSDTRIVINKKDGSYISEDDFNKIKKISNIDKVVENDVLLDQYVFFESLDDEYEYYYIDGLLKNINDFNYKIDYGRMPVNDNEVVIYVDKYDYYFTDMRDVAMNKIYYLNSDKNSLAVKVVGIVYQDNSMYSYSDYEIYVSDSMMDKFMSRMNVAYSDVNININNKNYEGSTGYGYEFSIVPSDKVSKANAIVYDGISYTCKDFICKNKNLKISISNLYYEDKLDLKISNVYDDKNSKKLLNINKDDLNYGAIFINKDEYNSLFNKNSYQASVFAKKIDYVDDIVSSLEDLGYNTLEIRKSLNNEGQVVQSVLKIVKVVVTSVLVITLFFISYFVIKLILKSRNIYFSTLRILGVSINQTKKILDIELFINSSLAYIIYIIFILLVKENIVEIEFIKNVSEYLNIRDYIIMYIILVLMSYLISSRFSSKIFKKSAMKSYREGV